jgi:hypothetical protein
MGRKILAGFLAALAMFVYGMISHMALGLTDRHLKTFPNEAAVIEGLRTTVPGRGLYLYPSIAMDAPPELQASAMIEYNRAYSAGPRGILIYEPTGGTPSFPLMLARQFLFNAVVAFTAMWLLGFAAPQRPAYWSRVCFVASLGVLASFFVDFPYWNWYSFPTGYTLAVLLDRTLMAAAGGLVLAYFVKPLRA